ncbi:protein MCM10 homolog [Malaya genurostris]|uniref:protein MCM10 homolog n=1 Tax=Malaya genurostris TaxID=325434 RepID=UPI0026F3979A|nr:protein MCM10 homolog [Malaya genurostris]
MSINQIDQEQSSIEIDELEQLLLDAEAEDAVLNTNIVISQPSSTTVISQSSSTTAIKPRLLSLSGSTFLSGQDQNICLKETSQKPTNIKSSAVHSGDTDSSDDEETRNFLERKYDEYGRSINKLLKQKEEEKIDFQISNFIDRALKNAEKEASHLPRKVETAKKISQNVQPFPGAIKVDNIPIAKNVIPEVFKKSVYTDPIFGIRLVHPLVSSAILQERMQGRKPISMARVKAHVEHGDLKEDWALAGVIVSKSSTKTTSKGGQFAIWKLSDLHGDIKMISLFLFSQAYKELWKTAEGMVICILNPGVFDRNEDRNSEVTLSIDKSAKVMVLGQSKDFGTCRSKKKNGEKCTAVVNLGECEHCVYHVKQEYNKACNRGGLISSTAGRGLNELRNKVLGKSEVFYGGQSFSAIKATRNPKQDQKDKSRLMTLSEYYQSPFQGDRNNSTSTQRSLDSLPSYRQQQLNNSAPKKGSASGLEINIKQREKDVERLKQLGLGEAVLTSSSLSKGLAKGHVIENSRPTATNGFENRSFSIESKKTPRLSTGNFVIDLGASPKQILHSRQKAIEIIKKKPLEKSNPNFIKHRGTEAGKKRALEQMETNDETGSHASKKQKLELEENARKERIQQLIAATSSHTDLIQAHEDEQQEKYFKDLERKEAMEEKMMNTFQVACKAVICTNCKYIAFSAADRCKEEHHELKVRDAEKRFFKCADCGNRTVSLHRLPKTSCRNCQSSRWERCAMMRDRNGPLIGASLSIRGDEEKFLGSCANSANLNLLVPVEDC